MTRVRTYLCLLALWVSIWAYAAAEQLNREAVEGLLRSPAINKRRVLKVYVAAPKAEIGRALTVVLMLKGIPGVDVVSVWHDVYVEGTPDPDACVEAQRLLNENVAALRQADLLVALTCETAGRGVYTEIGRALEREIDVIWSLERDGRAIDWADEHVLIAYTDEAAVSLVAELTEEQVRPKPLPMRHVA